MKTVPFRSSFEPTSSFCLLAYVAASRASLPPAVERKRPFETSDGVTTPIPGFVVSTPPIV